MSDELELSNLLTDLGCEVGRSKNGRLLRIDNRPCSTEPGRELLDRIIGCDALRELYLRDVCGFLNENFAAVAAMKKLQVLDVEGSDLNDASLEQIAGSPTLRVLNIRRTRVTDERVAGLRKKMINTRIIS